MGLWATSSTAQTYNMYGVVGGIEMPTATMAPDGELTFGVSQVAKTTRTALSFQITPNLSGTFRYARIGNWSARGETYDRSFDLKYRFWDEGSYVPAVSVGLQDFIGTGIYSAEYVVATKTFGSLETTAGLGWGRLGSYKPAGSFGTRPNGFTGTGGQIESAKWFQGDFAPFAAASWKATDRLTFKAEYSSDAQVAEVNRNHFERTSPFNFGLDYQFGRRSQLSAYVLHGSEFGLLFTVVADPKNGLAGPSRDGAPLPVSVRPAGSAADLGWTENAPAVGKALSDALGPVFDQSGLRFRGLTVDATSATVRLENIRYAAQSQAVGRTARILSVVLPGSIETFHIVLMERGVPLSRTVVSRSDLERLEFAPSASDAMRNAVAVLDAADVDRRAGRPTADRTFTWAIGPYLSGSLFDPNSPLQLDVGVELDVEWNPTPGLYFNGLLRQPLLGNLGDSPRFSDSVLPHVRSDTNFYNRADGPILERLTASYFFRPGKDLYGRISAGYLERQYGGVSTEVLWKPVNSRFALGAEVNYARQRSWDGRFGFTPNTVVNTDPITDTGFVAGPREYDTVTGHVSAYYAFDNDFHMQLDVGRYLAGDVGATLRLDREFNNGWRVGAYATLTDVSFDRFGEGSFDKGIVLTIPLDWQIGQASRRKSVILIQPILRDGGARLNLDDRLYEVVRDSHKPELNNRWARFWR